MKTVVIDGVTYTKVSELARAHQYTTDYLGQLCRSGKVEAELVGRAWYASEESLLAHKDGRYKTSAESDTKSPPSEITSNRKLKVHSTDRSTKVLVHPRVSKTTLKVATQTVPAPLAPTKQFYQHAAPNASLYIPDTTDLLPQTTHRARFDRERTPITPTPEVKLHVRPAEAAKVSVKSVEKPLKLSFSPVPEVSLRGPLQIRDLDSEAGDADYLVSETDIRSLQPRTIRPKLPGQQRLPLKRAVPTKQIQPTVPALSQPSQQGESPQSPIPSGVRVPVSFTPESIQVVTVRRSYLIPVVIVGALAGAFLLVGLDTKLVTDGATVTEQLHFNTASLLQIWQHLSGR